jgi:hypothetical protein
MDNAFCPTREINMQTEILCGFPKEILPCQRYAIFYFDANFIGIEGYSGEGWYFWSDNSDYLVGPFKESILAETALSIYYSKM